MIRKVSEAIIRRFNAYAPLKNELGGRLYFQQALQEDEFPYGTFMFNSITQEEIMGAGSNNITQVDIQFNLFSNDMEGGEGISHLTQLLLDCYHWNELIIDGWTCLKMQRETVLPILFIDEIWQSSNDFSLWIQE